MMLRLTTLRAATALAVLGAMALAGCGGGGSKSMGPLPATAGSTPQTKSQLTTGTLSVVLPTHTSGATAQSSSRVSILSATKKPAYIDTTTQNSSLVVAVTPQDPSEADQFGSLTVCYPLYTGGTLTTGGPNETVTPTAPNSNIASTVTLTIPSPPGTDTFQITQYAGLCGGPYTAPTPPPTTVGSSNILAQTPPVEAYMAPGMVNQLNQQIFNCTPAPAAGVPCPLTTANNGTTVLAASIAIANIQFGAVPITTPVREQGAFLLAAGKIGIPIPLEAVNAAAVVVPGLTTPAVPLGGAGPFPSGVTVTSNDTTGNTALYLVDATNGAIAQVGGANGLSIHEFNALSGNTTTGLTNDCTGGAAAPSCNDITAGPGAVAGDPWVIVLTYTGVDASKFTSVTVTATATIPPATTPTVITTTIAPQSAVYSAGGTGYADAAAPAAPLAMIQPIAGGSVYFTDGNKVKIDGTATVSAATGTTLTGLAYAAGPATLYAVDNAATGAAMGVPSGLYNFNPATLAVTAVTTQDGNLNPVQFKAPVGSVYAADTLGNSKLYVMDGNGIEVVDIAQATQLATNVAPLNCTGTPLAAVPTGVKLLGTVPVGSATSTFLVADPGATRIANVTVTGFSCTIATYASGAPFTGLSSGAAAGSLYATSTTGQIYYISGSGATPVSLGFATGSAADGPIGQIASFTPTATPTMSAVNYPLQFAAGSFFSSTSKFAGPTAGPYSALAAPYTIAPFGGSKVFAAPPAAGVGLIADTSAAAPPTTGVINATGGIVLVPTTAAAAATVTPDSILFVDSAGATGKLRTIVR